MKGSGAWYSGTAESASNGENSGTWRCNLDGMYGNSATFE